MFRGSTAIFALGALVTTSGCHLLLGIESTQRDDDARSVDAGDLCGNGEDDPGEECDDNNLVSGDGCSAVCLDETIACVPDQIGSYTTNRYGRVLVEGGIIHLVSAKTLEIIDASDPTSPGFQSMFSLSSGDYPNHVMRGVAKRGDFLWLGGTEPRLLSVDVSTPSLPVLGYQSGPQVSDGEIEIIDDTLFLSSSVSERPNAYDISGNTTATYIAAVGDPGNVHYNLTAAGDFVYASNFSNGVDIINISALPTSSVAGRYEHASNWNSTSGVKRMALDDNLLAISVNANGGADGVHLVNVTLPGAPAFITTINEEPEDIALRDGYLYLTRNDGLRVYDVRDPSSPAVAGTFVELNAFSAGITVDDDYVYLSTESGIRIVEGMPGRCEARCGNNTVEYPEACDDGNHDDGDGCAADCSS